MNINTSENYNKARRKILKGYVGPIISLIISLFLIITSVLAVRGCNDVGCFAIVYPFGLGIILFILFLIFFSINISHHLELKQWNKNEQSLKRVTNVNRWLAIILFIVYILNVIRSLSYGHIGSSVFTGLMAIIPSIIVAIILACFLFRKSSLNSIINTKINRIVAKNIVVIVLITTGVIILFTGSWCSYDSRPKQCNKNIFCKSVTKTYVDYSGERTYTRCVEKFKPSY